MKRFLILLLLSFGIINLTIAGRNNLFGWFHITPKFGVGTSLITNGEMFKQDGLTPGVLNLSYMFGGQLGVAFVDVFDVSFEINYNITGQRTSISMTDLGYDKYLKMSCLDYAVLFKYIGSTNYFEAGASISNLNDVLFTNTVSNNQTSAEPVFLDNTNQFREKYNNIILGFGGTLLQVDLFEITVGIRAKYSIQPVIKDNTTLINDGIYTGNFDNSGIRNMSFLIELNIHNFFGFFGKSICGGRRVILFQKPTKLF